MNPALWIASAVSVVGFCINAALVVCKKQHGDWVGAEDSAYQGIFFLIVAVILGLIAWSS